MSKYEILEPLARGGMGETYRARHRLLGEDRLIKVIRHGREGDQAFRARFLREARTAAALRHSNLAVIHDFALSNTGDAYIVMEYVRGPTLRQALRARDRLSTDLVVEIGLQILDVLEYLHNQGVVHRDISPENLILSVDRTTRLPLTTLIDFGIAKNTEGEGLTESGVFLGKPLYASPEQLGAIPGTRLDGRSDLYSLGIVLRELLTGEAPNTPTAPSTPISASDSVAGDPDRHTTARLVAVIERATRADPERRYPDAASFRAPLDEVRNSFPEGTYRPRAHLGWIGSYVEPSASESSEFHPVQAALDAEFAGDSLVLSRGAAPEGRDSPWGGSAMRSEWFEELRQAVFGVPSDGGVKHTFARVTTWVRQHPAPSAIVAMSLAALLIFGLAKASTGREPPGAAPLTRESAGSPRDEASDATQAETPVPTTQQETQDQPSSTVVPTGTWGLVVDDPYYASLLTESLARDFPGPQIFQDIIDASRAAGGLVAWPVAVISVDKTSSSVEVRSRQLPVCEVLVSARLVSLPTNQEISSATFRDSRPDCGTALATTARAAARDLQHRLAPLIGS